MHKKKIKYAYQVGDGSILGVFSTKKAAKAYCKTFAQLDLRDMCVERYALDMPWLFSHCYTAKEFLREG